VIFQNDKIVENYFKPYGVDFRMCLRRLFTSIAIHFQASTSSGLPDFRHNNQSLHDQAHVKPLSNGALYIK
jgi:hypothetical protein